MHLPTVFIGIAVCGTWLGRRDTPTSCTWHRIDHRADTTGSKCQDSNNIALRRWPTPWALGALFPESNGYRRIMCSVNRTETETNGTLQQRKMVGQYENGKRVGGWRGWTPDGQLFREGGAPMVLNTALGRPLGRRTASYPR